MDYTPAYNTSPSSLYPSYLGLKAKRNSVGEVGDNGKLSRGHPTNTPMPPTSVNTGSDARYMPPQKRVMHFGEVQSEIYRTPSAMSNDSLVSQAHDLDGGVSLNQHYGSESKFAGSAGAPRAGTGNQMASSYYFHGQCDRVPASIAEYGRGAMTGMYEPLAAWNSHGVSQTNGRVGGDFGAPFVSYAYHNMHSRTPSFLNQGSVGLPQTDLRMPSYGAIGSAPRQGFILSTAAANGSLTRRSKSGSRTNASMLADIVRSGACDFVDELDGIDPITGYRPRCPKPENLKSTYVSITSAPIKAPPALADATLDPTHRGNQSVTLRTQNVKGNAAAYVDVKDQPLPTFFPRLSQGYKPTIEEFFFVMPVIEPCRIGVASNAGVLRINNIPFAATRSEISAMIGRNAKIVSQPMGSPYFAIHIIMERHTGKTMDAFIEFFSQAEAEWVHDQFNKRIIAGRHPRLGDRHVDIVLSSQEELMAELFPRAKYVAWDGATPRITANTDMYYPGIQSAGFSAFLSVEEVTMTIKHAETPHRSAFAQRAIIRVYESWISTLHKFPWYAVDCITISERDMIFSATMSITDSLLEELNRSRGKIDPSKPTPVTLQELTVAVLTCPGFSEQQKSKFVQKMGQTSFNGFTNSRGMNIVFGGVAQLARSWPFKVLAITPGVKQDMVTYFANLLRDATTRGQTLSRTDRFTMRMIGADDAGPFGAITFEYGNAKTLADVAKVELGVIDTLLSRVLPA
ncbi:hypothetical protein BAUCODRAFT_25533 [Baudoinia panamericana UAMH 10762]|uniref:RRM domain-containing protein n=1 Tax=Baudoinia panamericana (strain UAMH 10762) TaxID=717646 RepID=M2LJA4_BAUPA|nr:uncharacterized protein BAUCODRAFT_25533 [Baudoinia panamericana UAMH 10762]EMC94317.1 hypothetical protein BAUCODRAFT_25533 [Baudoinia panamericana UAMH 10762]